jgi:hypothetical protein
VRLLDFRLRWNPARHPPVIHVTKINRPYRSVNMANAAIQRAIQSQSNAGWVPGAKAAMMWAAVAEAAST